MTFLFTPSFWQIVTAIFSALSATIGFVVALRNFPRFLHWLKRREILIAERNVAISRMEILDGQLKDARAGMTDLRASLESLRSVNTDLLTRMESLEEVRPVYDAMVGYLPRCVEYIAYIESVAKLNNLDLGREMPALPEILVSHFFFNKNKRQLKSTSLAVESEHDK